MRYVLIYLIGKGLSRVPYQAIIEVTFLVCNKNWYISHRPFQSAFTGRLMEKLFSINARKF